MISNPLTDFHKLVFKKNSNYSEEIKQQCKLQKEMLKIYDFKVEEGNKCVDWIEKYCIFTEGENAGQPVRLLLFQKWIIHSIFDFWGYLDVEEFDDSGAIVGTQNKYVRIVNDVLYMVASGNGKTSLVGYIIAYIMYHKKVLPSPKVYIGSNAYKQSRLCFDTTMNVIRSNKSKLLCKADIRESIGEIEVKETRAKLIAMSSDGTNFEGIIPALLVIDEIHEMKTSTYADNLRKSTKRSDSLIIETTTDGTVRGGYLDKRKEEAHNLLSGSAEVKNYRKFFAIFKQDSADEVYEAYRNNNLSILMKSNPALSKAVSVEILKQKIIDMINDPSNRVTTLTKNFNIPQNPITSYFTERECITKTFDESIFYNAPVFVGLDMAYTRTPESDLTCLEILMVNPLTNEEYCKDFYFLPKYYEQQIKEDGKIDIVKSSMIIAKSKEDSNILYNPKQDKYGYQLYADRGDVVIVDEELIETLVSEFGEQARCDTTGITEDFIIYYLAHLELKYNLIICKIGLDPNKASKIESTCNSSIQSLDGKYMCVQFRMEDKKNSNPIIQSTKDIRARRLVYNNNKLTELHFASAQAKEDQYGNIIFTNNMRERKDGVIANLSARSAYNVFVNNKYTGEKNLEQLIEWWQTNAKK